MYNSVAFLVNLLGSLEMLKGMIGTILGLDPKQFKLVSDYLDPIAGDCQPVLWTTMCGNDKKVLWDFIKEIIFAVTVKEANTGRYGSPFDKKR
jgi:hypothetical protein